MKKTIFALLLLVALVAVLAIPAAAEEPTTYDITYHCTCGSFTCDGNPDGELNNSHNLVRWSPFDNSEGNPRSGYWYLTDDVELKDFLNPVYGEPLGIDLAGHTLSSTSTSVVVVNVGESKFILTDTVGTGVLDYSKTSANNQYGLGIKLKGRAAVVDMFGGTITGTRVATTGGAGVAVADGCEGAYFNMYGGTITGGKCNNTNNPNLRGGGNVGVFCNSYFRMYGGTVSNGEALGSLKVGGNIFVSSGNVQIFGGKVLGGNAADGGASIYHASGHVRLGNAVVTTGNTDTDLVTGVYSAATTGNNLILCGAQKMRLESNVNSFVVENAVEVDLNGYNITNLGFRFASEKQIKVYDSKTADFTDTSFGKITNVQYTNSADAATSTIARDFVVDGNRYIAINNDDGWSFHRIYVALKSAVVATAKPGALQYKTVLKASQYVLDNIAEYGIKLTVDGQTAPVPSNVALQTGSMNEVLFVASALEIGAADNQEWAEKDISANAYIKLSDDYVVDSAVKSTSLQKLVEAVIANQTLDADAKSILITMYDDYNYNGFMDAWCGGTFDEKVAEYKA